MTKIKTGHSSIQGEKIMKNVNMNPDAKLSFLERFAYGIGDYAGNLIYSAISAFLLVYYTNVIGASAAAAASIIAISKFLDGISDLAMGYIVDHTHSKWGKARPWPTSKFPLFFSIYFIIVNRHEAAESFSFFRLHVRLCDQDLKVHVLPAPSDHALPHLP